MPYMYMSIVCVNGQFAVTLSDARLIHTLDASSQVHGHILLILSLTLVQHCTSHSEGAIT